MFFAEKQDIFAEDMTKIWLTQKHLSEKVEKLLQKSKNLEYELNSLKARLKKFVIFLALL